LILDVSRLGARRFERSWTAPHQPMAAACRTERTSYREWPVGVYTTTWGRRGFVDLVGLHEAECLLDGAGCLTEVAV